MNKYGIIDENEFDDQNVISDQPISLDMLPSEAEPIADDLSMQLAQSDPSIVDRFQSGMKESDSMNNSEYSDVSDRANKMELYGNLLDSYQNTIKNSLATVVPNFQKDGVAESLRSQGRNLLNEFYKKKQNKRQDQDQVGQNLAKEMGLESSSIDLKEKKAYTDASSPIANVYKNFLKTNFKKYLPDMTEDEVESLSPQRSAELVKLITEQNQANQNQALGWERLLQQKEENALNRDLRSDLQKEKLEDKEKERARLSDKQVSDLTNLDQALDQMGIIEAEKTNVDTGKLASARNSIAQTFGIDDSEISAFKARVGSQLAEYIKSISGAAVSDQERKFLLENMPKLEDNDPTFMSKLNMVKDRLGRNKDVYITNLKRQGKNVDNFVRPSDTPKQSAPYGDIVERNGKKYKWNNQVGKYQPTKE